MCERQGYALNSRMPHRVRILKIVPPRLYIDLTIQDNVIQVNGTKIRHLKRLLRKSN